MTVLSVRNLETFYGAIMALRGVSIDVEQGEIVTILGANGAGKTTLMKTIAGLMDPEKGNITFMGDQIGGLDPDRVVQKGIALVPEGREVFPYLTIEENLKLGAFTRRDSSAEDMELVYQYFPILKERRRQAAGFLSGGQQQNAHIALTTAHTGYVLEMGRIVMAGSTEKLRASDDIQEFYLGKTGETQRDQKRWKRRKTWR